MTGTLPRAHWLLATIASLTFAAPSAMAQLSLTTTYASNNGLDGNMFDILALEDVQIFSFDCNFYAGQVDVEIYTVAGGYVGHEAIPGDWTLVASGTVTSPGPDQPTPLTFPIDIPILAGQVMGLYITSANDPGIKYTDGTGLVYSSNEMELYEGCGVAYPFGNTYQPRTWNGTVYYYAETGERYCFGDGSGLICPCANQGGTEEGCQNSTLVGATLLGSGSTSASADTLIFAGHGLVPGQSALLFAGNNEVNGGLGNLFGDGLRCAGGGVVRLGVRVPNSTGDAVWGPGLVAHGGFSGGETKYFQIWYRDPGVGPCGTDFNLSHGVKIVFAP